MFVFREFSLVKFDADTIKVMLGQVQQHTEKTLGQKKKIPQLMRLICNRLVT